MVFLETFIGFAILALIAFAFIIMSEIIKVFGFFSILVIPILLLMYIIGHAVIEAQSKRYR